MNRPVFEMVVSVDGELHTVRIEAATEREAIDRASRIWIGGQVTVVGRP